jgi:hypothetical protein
MGFGGDEAAVEFHLEFEILDEVGELFSGMQAFRCRNCRIYCPVRQFFSDKPFGVKFKLPNADTGLAGRIGSGSVPVQAPQGFLDRRGLDLIFLCLFLEPFDTGDQLVIFRYFFFSSLISFSASAEVSVVDIEVKSE